MALNEERFRAAERNVWTSFGVSPTEQRVQLRTGETVRVQEAGEGPPILLVHGASNSGVSWAPLMTLLSGFRCIALDRPGCGLSEPVAGGVKLADFSAVEAYSDALIPNVLDALGLASANVVATSYGGYFAFRGAAAHPDRIDRVVEFSWPMGAPMTKVPFSMRISGIPGIGQMMARVPPTRGAVRMILRQVGLKNALATGRFTDEMLESFLSLLRDTDSMLNELRSSPPVITPIRGLNTRMLFPRELLAKVSMPVLFIWGGDDPNGGEDVARPLAAQIPNAQLEMLPTAGHAPWIDDAERSAALMRAFLDS